MTNYARVNEQLYLCDATEHVWQHVALAPRSLSDVGILFFYCRKCLAALRVNPYAIQAELTPLLR